VRRRLLLVVVGSVLLAIVLSGLFTLVVLRRSARDEVRRELVSQAQDLATQSGDLTSFRVLAAASRALRVEGLGRVTFLPSGRVEGELPPGISVADLRPSDLAAGATVSGHRGALVFVATPVAVPAAARRLQPALRRGVTAIVLTRDADPGTARTIGWFALSTLVSVAVAVVVADRLARRITQPLVAAEDATRRIAAGDLDVRVPVADTGDAELASLTRSVNTMAEALARSRGLERQFLLAVSHDLRTPLTSIRGFADAVADGVEPDHVKAATVIGAESRRLERLVGDLLELAKLDARQFSLQLGDVDVAEVVGVTAEGFRPELDELGIDLVVDVPDGRLPARADPDRLAQVVANLVENALKYARSRIVVTARPGDGGRGVVLMVDDDGPGIAAADLPHVFERLYTSARHPARKVGSGLGLAIVHELVTAMGGEVQATAAVPDGTRVLVRLSGPSSSSSAAPS
jgi:two-component system OmpR family sensor kinase